SRLPCPASPSQSPRPCSPPTAPLSSYTTLFRSRPCCNHDILCFNLAAIGVHALYCTQRLSTQSSYFRIRKNSCPIFTRDCQQSFRRNRRLDLTVFWVVDRRCDLGVKMRLQIECVR